MADNTMSSSHSSNTSAKTILVIEDDPHIGEMFVQTLNAENIYTTVLVTSGAQALEAIKTLKPDLFLLDYHLPEMNGLELYDTLHAMPEFSNTPAILATAGVLEHDIAGRRIVGVSKPVDINKLLNLVADLLEQP